MNLLIIKPFFLIKEKETDECDEDTEFTASMITAFFGRYDNESPPLLMFFLRYINELNKERNMLKI